MYTFVNDYNTKHMYKQTWVRSDIQMMNSLKMTEVNVTSYTNLQHKQKR